MLRQNSQTSQVWVPMTDMAEGRIPNGDYEAKLLDNDELQTKSRVPYYESHETPATYIRRSILEDIKSLMFWKAVLAEFLGTCFLVMVAVGATLQTSTLDIVQISLSFGLCVASAVWIFGHISGGHVNPAVTIAMFVTRKISLIRAIFYIFAQCAGSLVGAGILKGLTPSARQGGLGATTLSEGVTPIMGVGIELFITMLLVLTVFAACDSKRNDLGGSFPLTIGLAVTVGHLWAIEFCGGGMNPARSLGPAIVMNIWKDHWVYWVGPMTGGVCAGLLYENLFAFDASLAKAKKFFLMSKTDEEAPSESNTKMIRKLLSNDGVTIKQEPGILISPVA